MSNLSFTSLVLIPSEHCNLQCRHCAPECGPHSKAAWDVPLLKQCISDASKLDNLEKIIHFAGGEPFLYFDSMLELAKHATQCGFSISVVTNGFWSRNVAKGKQWISSLKEAGLYRAELSTDQFHQEHLPIEHVKNAISILKENNIEIVLRIITTKKHTVDKVIARFSPDDLDGVEICGSPVVPVGRAAEAIPEEEIYLKSDGIEGACYQLLNLTVNANGNVSPCCAGSEYTPSLSLGNIYTDSINTLVARAERNLLLKKIVNQGPSSFHEILVSSGLEKKIQPSYTNVCHACSHFLNDEEILNSINSWIHKEKCSKLARKLELIHSNVAVSTDS